MDPRSSQISDVQIHGRRASSDDCAGLVGFGLSSPRQVGYIQLGRIDWARDGGLALSIES